MLHEGHPGISKMKALARSYVRWPKIDSDIEAKDSVTNVNLITHPSGGANTPMGLARASKAAHSLGL